MKTRVGQMAIALSVLSVVYVVLFTDWLNPGSIEIVPTVRPIISKNIGGKDGAGATYPVAFALDSSYRLKSIRVVEESTTNGVPRTLWHLTSGSLGSVPVKVFVYGGVVSNMHPLSGFTTAEPLQAEVKYHVYIQSGRRKGDVIFSTHARNSQAAFAPQ